MVYSYLTYVKIVPHIYIVSLKLSKHTDFQHEKKIYKTDVPTHFFQKSCMTSQKKKK